MVRPPAFQRGFVGPGVDAQGEAADYGHAALRQAGAEIRGNAAAVVRGASGADHGDGHFVCGQQSAAAVQHRGRVGGFLQAPGVLGVVPGQNGDAGFRQAGQLGGGVDRLPGIHNCLGYAASDAGGAQFPRPGVPSAAQVGAEMRFQHTEAGCAQAGYPAQRNPIAQIFRGQIIHGGDFTIAFNSPTIRRCHWAGPFYSLETGWFCRCQALEQRLTGAISGFRLSPE